MIIFYLWRKTGKSAVSALPPSPSPLCLHRSIFLGDASKQGPGGDLFMCFGPVGSVGVARRGRAGGGGGATSEGCGGQGVECGVWSGVGCALLPHPRCREARGGERGLFHGDDPDVFLRLDLGARDL